MRWRLTLLSMAVLLVTVLLAGCSTTLDADDYERSCGRNSDCVAILVGDMCECSCDMSAINILDADRYQEDRDAISCGSDCGACPGALAVCRAGLCEAVAE